MEMLVSTFAVDRIAIRPIAERGSFVLDRLLQDLLHPLMDARPLDFTDSLAWRSRIDSSSM